MLIPLVTLKKIPDRSHLTSVPHGRESMVSSWRYGCVVEAFHITVDREGERLDLRLGVRL